MLGKIVYCRMTLKLLHWPTHGNEIGLVPRGINTLDHSTLSAVNTPSHSHFSYIQLLDSIATETFKLFETHFKEFFI